MKELNAYEIVQILNRPCKDIPDKGQWVQTLMLSLKTDKILVIGRVEKGVLKNYAVAVYRDGLSSLKYISDEVMGDQEYKKAIYEWAEKFGVGKVKHLTTDGG